MTQRCCGVLSNTIAVHVANCIEQAAVVVRHDFERESRAIFERNIWTRHIMVSVLFLLHDDCVAWLDACICKRGGTPNRSRWESAENCQQRHTRLVYWCDPSSLVDECTQVRQRITLRNCIRMRSARMPYPNHIGKLSTDAWTHLRQRIVIGGKNRAFEVATTTVEHLYTRHPVPIYPT